jgi:hypothetical protein
VFPVTNLSSHTRPHFSSACSPVYFIPLAFLLSPLPFPLLSSPLPPALVIAFPRLPFNFYIPPSSCSLPPPHFLLSLPFLFFFVPCPSLPIPAPNYFPSYSLFLSSPLPQSPVTTFPLPSLPFLPSPSRFPFPSLLYFPFSTLSPASSFLSPLTLPSPLWNR